MLETLNQSFDPGKGRFRIQAISSLVTKPGQSVDLPGTEDGRSDHHLVDQRPVCCFEFDGALPRASLYDDWRWDDSEEVVEHTCQPGL